MTKVTISERLEKDYSTFREGDPRLTGRGFFEIILTEENSDTKQERAPATDGDVEYHGGTGCDIVLSTVWAASFSSRNATVLFCFFGTIYMTGEKRL